MAFKTGLVPAALAEVDNQKNAETCSLFAISKAVCNGFETDKFFPGYLDFDQGETKTALLGQIIDANVLKAKYPTEFDAKFFPIQDKQSDYHSVTLSIKQTTLNEFKRHRSKNNKFEHLIVTDLGTGPHCLFVVKYDSVNDIVICINSWGPNNNPKPTVKIGDVMNIYRVSASALTLQQSTTVQQVTSLLSAQNLNSSTRFSSPQQTQVYLSNADIDNIDNIIKNCETCDYDPPRSEIMQAARLASAGCIISIKYLKLKNINLDQIPPQQLSTLASCVTDEVLIRNVDGDPANVIKSVRCERLLFQETTLDVSQTKIVVDALKDRVESSFIGPGVSLDFDTLQQYDGSGKCWQISVYCTPSVPHKYKSKLESYGKVLGWKTDEYNFNSGNHWFDIKRHSI